MAKVSIWSLLVLATVCVILGPVSAGDNASAHAHPTASDQSGAARWFPWLSNWREKWQNLWNSVWPPTKWRPPRWPWQQQTPRCKKANEVYTRCASGSCAEEVCFLRKIFSLCPKNCGYGCYCKEGYCRNLLKECVQLTKKERPPMLWKRQ
ncbi:uncharacterized protein LOC144100020 [Amblyomma americanum]